MGSDIGLTGWRALASTLTVNAIDHIAPLLNDPNNLPIHRLTPGPGVNLISSSLADFWSNGATNAITHDENGIGVSGKAWTAQCLIEASIPTMHRGQLHYYLDSAFPTTPRRLFLLLLLLIKTRKTNIICMQCHKN